MEYAVILCQCAPFWVRSSPVIYTTLAPNWSQGIHAWLSPSEAGCAQYSWGHGSICTPSFPGCDLCPDQGHFSGGPSLLWGLLACLMMLLHLHWSEDHDFQPPVGVGTLKPKSWRIAKDVGRSEPAVNHMNRARPLASIIPRTLEPGYILFPSSVTISLGLLLGFTSPWAPRYVWSPSMPPLSMWRRLMSLPGVGLAVSAILQWTSSSIMLWPWKQCVCRQDLNHQDFEFPVMMASRIYVCNKCKDVIVEVNFSWKYTGLISHFLFFQTDVTIQQVRNQSSLSKLKAKTAL